MLEIDHADMMQNLLITHHSSSILKMQIFMTLSVIYAQRITAFRKDHFHIDENETGNIYLILLLLIEHIVSFSAGIFRDWEIKNKGRADLNGVIRGPIESFLMNVEQFLDYTLFGFIIKHYLELK